MEQAPKEADWRRWVEENTPRLLLFARQKARSEADAQDLLQEAVVECWTRQADGRPPDLALVFATIRRRAIDQARREDRRSERESVSVDPQDYWLEPAMEQREMQQVLKSAMSQLPEIYREVVTLKIWGGLTFGEIATALEVPANTAASRYRYGLEELRRLTRGVLT
jgi:RNA polymerase sigma-70 factor (ECF subfamily)